MKAMNEFESVLALAALILAVCATTDIPPAAPNAAAGRSGSDYAGYRVTPLLEPARQEATDIAVSGAAGDPLAMVSREADHGPRQERASW
ncbi:MAG: hypothetical protein NTY05_10970 [Rhodocyclales bacterium]|nr:hypothetical protein [Rhodocyclales bacterium]